MDDPLSWVMLVLMAIGLFTCVRFVWRLPSRLFRRKSPNERLVAELVRLNHQAAQTYLTELLEEADAQMYARDDAAGRNGAGRVGDGVPAAPAEGTRRT